MTTATGEQAPASTPRSWEERRAELLRGAALLAKPIDKVTRAGETATVDEAHRAAVFFVLMKVTTQIRVGGVEEAQWRDGGRPAWAFPLTLTFPDKGHVGSVGEVLVDARTCDIVDEEAARERIKADAHELALRTAP